MQRYLLTDLMRHIVGEVRCEIDVRWVYLCDYRQEDSPAGIWLQYSEGSEAGEHNMVYRLQLGYS